MKSPHNIVLLQATLEHVDIIAPIIRQADIDECFASSGHTQREVLEYGVNNSSHAWAIFVDDKPLGMAGVAPVSIINGIGAPWFLSTIYVDEYQMAFIRRSRSAMKQVLNSYSYLINFVDERHTVAQRWLKWLGFAVAEFTEPHGPYGMPFRRFELEKGKRAIV